ncbi:MAG: hypothetical protein IT323_12155 [Anaerolineae bacterium]|nr:hypothetical protein [Anaerolineae bacterium]
MTTRTGGQMPPEDDDRPISPSDLLSLPPPQRRVMRILLRSNGMSLAELSQALDALPPEERLPPDALANVVSDLEQTHWLARVEGTQPPVFRAARLGWTGQGKADERPGDRHRGGANRLNDFWDSVKEDEEKRPRPATPRRAESGQVSSLFSELARPNTSLSDVLAEHKSPPTKPGGGRISSLFDELSKRPDPDAELRDDEPQE